MTVFFILTVCLCSGVAQAFMDDFHDTYPSDKCLRDGAGLGAWGVRFTGYGCVSTNKSGNKTWLEEKPKTSTSPAETHAVMVTGPSFTAPYYFMADSKTIAQLRQNSLPNLWETGWWIFDYNNRPKEAGGTGSFYYFILKPNGWELGKKDVNYPGEQRFLATGKEPALVMQAWGRVEIRRYNANANGARIQVYYVTNGNRALITEYTDNEHPYSDGGAIGFYNEDADVLWTNVKADALSGK